MHRSIGIATNTELLVKNRTKSTDRKGVNTSFVTDVRRSFQSRLAATLRDTQRRNAFSVVALRCAKGLAISVAIGLAGYLASSVALPPNQATAATITFKPKLVAVLKQGKTRVLPKSSATSSAQRKPTKAPMASSPPTPSAQRVKTPPRITFADARYRVRAGESLSSIAIAKNTSVTALAVTNKLKSNSTLRVGQLLSLPKVELHGPKSLPARLRANPKRLAVRKHTAKWAKANDIPQDLLEATLWQESGFDQSKVSSTGAIGVGQIMPETAGFIEKELIGVDLNPRDTENNVRMSARYLRYLLKANHSDTTKALHAYYQGMGSIQDHGLYDDTVQYARNVEALRLRFKE